jgi:hypothetical protein
MLGLVQLAYQNEIIHCKTSRKDRKKDSGWILDLQFLTEQHFN